MLTPWDPFCIEETHTESLKPFTAKIEDSSGSGKVTLSPYILPKDRMFSSNENWKRAGGPRGWNAQQGFYFYRNGRLLQAGGWSYLRAPDEHTKLLRIAVDFPSTLDKTFEINVTKMRSKIPDAIRDEVKERVGDWVQKSKQVYADSKHSIAKPTVSTKSHGSIPARHTPEDTRSKKSDLTVGPVSMSVSNANTNTIAATAGQQGIRLIVPFKHISATAFYSKKGRPSEQRDALLTILALLEAVTEESIKPDKIPIDKIRKYIQKII
jgi:hypothetical protein